MLEIIMLVMAGILAGTFTGITPGIHVNLVSAMLLAFSPMLPDYVSINSLTCFIMAMAVTHTFLDTLPSTFLGAPDEDKALLPGHKYLLEGKAYYAVLLTTTGAFFSLLVGIVLMLFLLPFLKPVYSSFQPLLIYFLITIVIFMIWREKTWWGLIVFCLSGILGWLALNTPNLRQPLFPLLSGLFGISTLIMSLQSKTSIPVQVHNAGIWLKPQHFLTILLAVFTGSIAALLPGLGVSQTATLALQILPKQEELYLLLIGGIGAVNFAFSIGTLYALDKARNGAIATVQQLTNITFSQVMLYAGAAILAGAIALILTLALAKVFAKIVTRINYKVLAAVVLSFILCLTPIISGIQGLLILFTATAIGLLPVLTKCSRSHAMGCLLMPVILYFL